MHLKTVTIADLTPHPDNPNTHPTRQIDALGESLTKFEQVKNVVIWNGRILAGHGLIEAAQKVGRLTLEAVDMSARWDEETATAFMLADIRLPSMAEVEDAAIAAALKTLAEPTLVPGVDDAYLDALAGLVDEPPKEEAGPPQIDRADELRQEWGTELGQLWQLGPHRVICGDCTDGATVERLMGEERAILLHADPPYGMGKEKDGIANDNLYRDKLDSFQLQWWDACRGSLEDNGSVYIWGNAEDLWRLWYVGGLRDRERMTFRNQVIWDKPPSGLGDGQNNSIMRSYGIKYETLIFFMLGEQGFNNNADNYWDGWEPIRAYLKSERDKMGWDNKKVAEMFGFHPRMASHWFDESQWSFIKEGQYAKLQNAANNEAFKRDYDELKRDYDELKRDFYATRAYFDNTHDMMTDVWQFPRVKGPERWGHATPKPVPMIERIINTSAPKDTAILSPFLGSGTDLIAADNLNRTCYGSEIDPGYTAVILQRYLDHTGTKPTLTTP